MITQFLSESDLGLPITVGTDQIVAIRRWFLQNGKLYTTNPFTNVLPFVNEQLCNGNTPSNGLSGQQYVGGFPQVTKTMAQGMTLVISLFTFEALQQCTPGQDAGQGLYPPYDAYLAVSNIRWGELNSTY